MKSSEFKTVINEKNDSFMENLEEVNLIRDIFLNEQPLHSKILKKYIKKLIYSIIKFLGIDILT